MSTPVSIDTLFVKFVTSTPILLAQIKCAAREVDVAAVASDKNPENRRYDGN